MLLRGTNIHSKKIHHLPDEFDKLYDKDDVKKVILYGIKTHKKINEEKKYDED